MANLKETAQWEEGIYQIETSDPVMGGENGIDNKPLRQLANRTAYLKQALETAEQNNATALKGKAPTTHSHAIADITGLQAALNGKLGLRGLLAETDLDTLYGNTNVGIWQQNQQSRATMERHYPIINQAGTLLVLPSAYGGQQLYLPMTSPTMYRRHTTDNNGTWGAWQAVGDVQNVLTSDSTTAALSAAQGKELARLIKDMEGKGLPIGAVVAFPRAVSNPTGHLKADGSSFDAATYPDLYKALGNNKLPDLTRSDVGMTAYFPSERIPAGWLAFDEIADQVSASTYPELHAQLIQQYGSLDRVPKADDRFIRNASGSLKVGQVQKGSLATVDGHPNMTLTTLTYGAAVLQDTAEVVDLMGGDVLRGDEGYLFPSSASEKGLFAAHISPTALHAIAADGRSNLPTGDIKVYGVRPKSLVLKLCIKAKNTFDDVAFWIKAYGQIQSSGSLNADALAADIQNLRRDIQNNSKEIGQLTDEFPRFAREQDDKLTAFLAQFAALKQPNGYLKLPNGLIVQWGRGMAGAGGYRNTFPIAFPNALVQVQAVHIGTNTSVNIIIGTQSETDLTGFSAASSYVGHAVVVYFFAIGY